MAKVDKSLRTPLGGARFLGAAKLGTGDNWAIKVTATALIPLAIAFVWLMLDLLRKDYNGVRAELGHPLPALILLAFALVASYHMHIGMRSIILDYVDGPAREWALVANIVFAAAVGLVCAYATLRIGFV
jgi:succinate dehydrogenase / fumarate reductase membrane anchor subunit